MSGITRRYVSLSLARLVRSVGYRGQRTGVLLVLAATGGALLTVLASRALSDQVERTTSAGLPGLVAAVAMLVVLALYVACGPLVLVTDVARARDRHARGALAGLPLSRRRMSVLALLPAGVVGGYGLLLCAAMGVIALLGTGRGWLWALGLTALSLGAGLCHAVGIITLARALTRGRAIRAAVQPIAIIVWIVLSGLVAWRTISSLRGDPSVLDPVLVLPPTVSAVAGTADPLSTPVAVAGVLVLLLALAGLVAAWAVGDDGDLTTGHRPVLPGWRPTAVLPVTRLEVRRAVRSPAIVANVASATALAVALVLLLRLLPEGIVDRSASGIVQVAVTFIALPCVLLRGLSSTRWPPQLALGLGRTRWTASVVLASATLYLAQVAVVVVAIAADGRIATPVVAGSVASAGVLAWTTCLVLGWLVPASEDNPLAQVFTAVGSLAVVVTVLGVLSERAAPGSAPWWAVLAGLDLLLLSVPFAVERRRHRVVSAAPAARAGAKPEGVRT